MKRISFPSTKIKWQYTLLLTLFFCFSSILFSQFVIEDFNAGTINLISYPGEDIQPNSWHLTSTNTYQNSPFALRLFGNTWKIKEIAPLTIDTGSVWQVASFIQSIGKYQGFGLSDGENTLFYSFAGSVMVSPDEWISVYQGEFPVGSWNLYKLPVGDDWMAWFEYEPVINQIIFINDNDGQQQAGAIVFDMILDITGALPVQPQPYITHNRTDTYRDDSGRQFAQYSFNSYVYDPDSEVHQYFWEFGDGTTSNEQNPEHTYLVTSNHPYSVFLAVENEFGVWGFTSSSIELYEGDSNLPLKMNFVGDIILGRRYEDTGGIIQTQGVEAIFEPNLHLLGNAADITVANMECPLTLTEEQHPTKGISFKGHPDYVSGLVYAGIDIAMLANNHILDFMQPGLVETQQVLEDAGILHLGAGVNSYEAYLPIFLSRKGINVSFIASSDRNGHYNNFQPYLEAGFNKPGFAKMTPYYVQKQINTVREVSDIVVAMFHSGSEYSLGPSQDYDYLGNLNPFTPNDYEYIEEGYSNERLDIPKMPDRDFRQFVIDAGADIVINHHPHIIQGIEVYNGKVIAHSLGNYVFDLQYPETMPSMILNVEADDSGITDVNAVPVWIDRYIPQPAIGKLGIHILDYLARRSRELDSYLHIDKDKMLAHAILDTLNMQFTDTNSVANIDFISMHNNYRSLPLYFERNGSVSHINSISPNDNFSYRLGRELVWFGNFEDEGCTLWNTDTNSATYSNTEVFEGDRSLYQERSSGTGYLVTTPLYRIRKYINTDYTLFATIKTENANLANISLRYYDSRTGINQIGNELLTANISGNSDWTTYHKELSVPNNANYFEIRLISRGPSNGTGKVWFENVGLIEWTNWQQLTPDNNIISPNDFYYAQFQTPNAIETAVVNYTERVYSPIPQMVSADSNSIPSMNKAVLHNNYPNPFNAATNFSFSAQSFGEAELTLYNIKGQKVKTLFKAQVEKGELLSVPWNGKNKEEKDVASGVYFYRLTINDRHIDTKKCLLLK